MSAMNNRWLTARRSGWRGVALFVSALAGPVYALSPEATELRQRVETLRPSFASSPFRRPVVLEAAQGDDGLKGEVYALIDQPFGTAGPALQDRARWCDVLILHLNVKQCRARSGYSDVISMTVGRKFEQPAGAGKAVDFVFRVASAGSDFVRVQMIAESAPTDARDQLTLDAAPLDDKRTIVRVSYAYTFTAMERFGMQAYLSTLGRDKVGFSKTTDANGNSAHVGGVRGMVERNVMRYYLAVVVYVDSLAVPPAERLEKRLQQWFDATEQHAQQLHEMGRDEYLSMKRNETRGMP